MSTTQGMIEILIGKYLDGEITPSEQRILKQTLDENPDAKELLRQLQDIHEMTRQVVSLEVAEQGRSFDDIFQQASQQTKHPIRRAISFTSRMRFAAGLAAGFLLGIVLHIVLTVQPVGPNNIVKSPAGQQVALQNVTSPRTAMPVAGAQLRRPTRDVMNNIDWYNFTDETGNQWLIQGYRENMVTNAVYRPDL